MNSSCWELLRKQTFEFGGRSWAILRFTARVASTDTGTSPELDADLAALYQTACMGLARGLVERVASLVSGSVVFKCRVAYHHPVAIDAVSGPPDQQMDEVRQEGWHRDVEGWYLTFWSGAVPGEVAQGFRQTIRREVTGWEQNMLPGLPGMLAAVYFVEEYPEFPRVLVPADLAPEVESLAVSEAKAAAHTPASGAIVQAPTRTPPRRDRAAASGPCASVAQGKLRRPGCGLGVPLGRGSSSESFLQFARARTACVDHLLRALGHR